MEMWVEVPSICRRYPALPLLIILIGEAVGILIQGLGKELDWMKARQDGDAICRWYICPAESYPGQY